MPDNTKIPDFIYEVHDKQLKHIVIEDAIDAILDFMAQKLKQDHSISIKNFGTFAPSMRKVGRKQELRKVVRFHPHVTLLDLVDIQRNKAAELKLGEPPKVPVQKSSTFKIK